MPFARRSFTHLIIAKSFWHIRERSPPLRWRSRAIYAASRMESRAWNEHPFPGGQGGEDAAEPGGPEDQRGGAGK